jgi:hypothetical protein
MKSKTGVIKATEPGKLTIGGKRLSAEIMYYKGIEFIEASLLLKRAQQTSSFVHIYLLLKRIEILLKGILLLEDYDKYNHRILKKKFRHDISLLLTEVKSILR